MSQERVHTDERVRERARGLEAGFSLIEVVIALTILSVGLLAMASTTAYVTRQIRASDVRTARMEAVKHTVEALRALPNNGLSCGDVGADTVGEYAIGWQVLNNGNCTGGLRPLRVTTTGPGYASGNFSASVEETFETAIWVN